MCVHSLCDIVFHAVTHYEFDANLIRSGIIHERCERVPAIMGKMFHVELIHNCIEIRTNIGTVCVVIGRNLFICGVGYQMMLPNRNKSRYSPFELLVPSPLTTFVVYSNDAYREPVLGCTYSVHDDGTITLTAYSKNFCYTIEH